MNENTLTVSEDILAEAFNLWLEDYTNNPKEFEKIEHTAFHYLNTRLSGLTPTHGQTCVQVIKGYIERLCK